MFHCLLLFVASFVFTLSPAGPLMISGLLRRSLISAVTAMSITSSPKRRPFGQPPGIVPAGKPGRPACTVLVKASPPKTLSREKPASSGLVR